MLVVRVLEALICISDSTRPQLRYAVSVAQLVQYYRASVLSIIKAKPSARFHYACKSVDTRTRIHVYMSYKTTRTRTHYTHALTLCTCNGKVYGNCMCDKMVDLNRGKQITP